MLVTYSRMKIRKVFGDKSNIFFNLKSLQKYGKDLLFPI